MAYPGNGMEGTYRNNILDVSAMLNEYHRGHFCIYNLSGRKYDHSLFDEKNPECVQDWCYFPDHNPPPLPLLFELLLHMHRFLMADSQNVVIVHCLAGKGRTGTLIACYMMYAGLFAKASEALNFFAFKRSVTINGVSYPGQVRYVTYAQDMLDNATPVVPDATPIYLKSVTLTHVPKLYLNIISNTYGITPIIEIFALAKKVPEMAFSSAWASQPESYLYEPHTDGVDAKDKSGSAPCGKPIIIPVNKVLRGDVLIALNHCQPLSKQQQEIFRINFHTGFLHFDAKKITPVITRRNTLGEEPPQHTPIEKELLKRKKEEEMLMKIKSMSMSSLPSSQSPEPSLPSEDGDALYTVTFTKDQIDCITNDDRFPDSFSVVLAYQSGEARMNPLEEANFKKAAEGEDTLLQLVMGERPDPSLRNGEMCFFGLQTGEKIARARSQAASSGEPGVLIEKKGWLVKRGDKVKNWKKRWFVLRDNLSYFKSMKAGAPSGVIPLDKIISISPISGLNDSTHHYCFEIVVDIGNAEVNVKNMGLRSYIISASSEDEMNEWIDAINTSRMEKKSQR